MAWWDMFKQGGGGGPQGGGMPMPGGMGGMGGGGGMGGMSPSPPSPMKVILGAAGGAIKGVVKPSRTMRWAEQIAGGDPDEESPNAYKDAQKRGGEMPGYKGPVAGADQGMDSSTPMPEGVDWEMPPAAPGASAPMPEGADWQMPSFSSYADGQVVTKPTLALIGEDGPETVVPLSYRSTAKVRPSVAMGAEQVRKPRFYGQSA